MDKGKTRLVSLSSRGKGHTKIYWPLWGGVTHDPKKEEGGKFDEGRGKKSAVPIKKKGGERYFIGSPSLPRRIKNASGRAGHKKGRAGYPKHRYQENRSSPPQTKKKKKKMSIP